MGDISRPHNPSQRDPGQDRYHAETYLRLLAEAAVRAASDDAGTADRAGRAIRAADVLIDAGVLDDAQANEIMLMLAEALSYRGQRDWLPVGRARRLAGLTVVAHGTALPGPEALGLGTWQVIRTVSGQVPGSKLMALIVTAERMVAPATLRFPPSAGLTDLAAPSFADLTASDDTGHGYQVSFTDGGWTGSTWTGTIVFRPTPPPDAQLLTVTGPNGPVLRAQLSHDPAARPPVTTMTPLADSPGERLLIRRAEALIGAFVSPDTPGRHLLPDLPPGRRAGTPRFMRPLGLTFPGTAPPSPVTPGTGPSPAAVFSRGVADREPDLAEVIEILEGARILSPLSPIPARLAALSRALGEAAHPEGAHPEGAHPEGDRAARSAETLPARWHAVLAHYGRRGRQPVPSGTGSIGVTLPEVDGARFAVAGVHTGPAGTVLHVMSRGLRLRPGQETRFSWWVRDEGGGWHVAAVHSWNTAHADQAMRLALLPPLRPGDPGSAGTLALEVCGPTRRLTADLTVHW